jgi:hypothetical protein
MRLFSGPEEPVPSLERGLAPAHPVPEQVPQPAAGWRPGFPPQG